MADPEKFRLFNNYPNPFNPATNIRYSLEKPSQVRLTIYNLLGQEIKIMVDSFQANGEYSLVWDSTDERNNPVSSGMYLYRLETEGCAFQKKMILVK